LLCAGALCKSFGWQWGMMAPGAFGLAAGMVLLVALRDKPEDAGAWWEKAGPNFTPVPSSIA
jgi:sugar phosphate permease